jgi:hypothetical protein
LLYPSGCIILSRYEKTDVDEDTGCSTEAGLCVNVKEILIQIFNFRRLKSPTSLSSQIVAWEVLIFCEYCYASLNITTLPPT